MDRLSIIYSYCSNSSVDLISAAVGRLVINIPHCRQSQFLQPDVIYNGQCAQCTYFHQLQPDRNVFLFKQLGYYFDACVVHFIMFIVPVVRLHDCIRFIFIFEMPSEYRSIFVLHRSKQETLTPP